MGAMIQAKKRHRDSSSLSGVVLRAAATEEAVNKSDDRFPTRVNHHGGVCPATGI